MNPMSDVPEKIGRAIQTLPAPAQAELAQFSDCLQYKYGELQPTVVSLANLWADIDINIEQRDVQQLRQELSTQLEVAFQDNELSG